MLELMIENDKFLLPSSANEMTAEQLLFLASLSNHVVSVEEIKLKLLLMSLGAQIYTVVTSDKRNILVISGRKYALTSSQFVQITSVFDFLFTPVDKDNKCLLKPKLTAQKFPVIQIGCKMFHGCEDAFSDCTYEQFIYLTQFSELNDINSMIAVMYLSKKGEFDPSGVEKRALAVAKISPNMILILTWFFQSSLEFLAEKFPHVFVGGGDGSVSKNSFDTQNKIIDRLADGDVTKKPIVRQSLLYDVLYTLENAATNHK